MLLSVFGDAIVAVLLIATISYAAVLNRRLAVLRSDRDKLAELVKTLATATQRAEAGVANLKAAAADTGRQLEKRVEQARSLRDDLAYMIDRGVTAADRLEGMLRAKREEPKPAEPKSAAKAEKGERRNEPSFDIPGGERKVEAIRRAMEARQGSRQASGPTPAARLGAALGEEPPSRRPLAPSRAERDLLRALATLR